jgi:autotransporter-associated beta strand protein
VTKKPIVAARCPTFLTLFYILLAWAIPSARTHAQIVINEIQSSNDQTITDEDGDASDWIELHNPSTNPVNLDGWGLSDDPALPMKWAIPAHTIPPGGYLLIWASGKNRIGPYTPNPPALTNPDTVPGLVLWLDAIDLNLAPNAAVSTWSDLSGNNNHAVAPSTAASPFFRTNRINGHPAIQFTKTSNHLLALPHLNFNGLDNLGNFTAITLARLTSGNLTGIMGAWGANPNTSNTHFEVSNPNQLRLRVGTMNDVRANSAVTPAEWALFGASMTTAGPTPTGRLYKNNTLIASKAQAPGPTTLSNYSTFAIGASDSTRSFNGDIAAFLLFDRELSAIERESVGTYLSNRYGISTSSTAGYHTNFSIAESGETLTLTRPDGSTADSTPTTFVPIGSSLGRSPDAIGPLAHFATPTPATSNTTTSFNPPSASPSFSEPRGFKENPFSLTLSHPDPAAQIRYTLDGSTPTATSGTVFNTPISISQTTVVRAIAVVPGSLPYHPAETHTYLFADDIIQLTARPPSYPSTWNGFAQTSYAISPFTASQPGYAQTIKAALASLPTLSLTMSPQDFFGTDGVYSNPTIDDFEKPVSAEWIGLPGTPDFQINAGLRVQGGASRQFANTPKKSLRLLFKDSYGAGRLRQPVLAQGGTTMDDFNSIVLRADYNNSWLHWDGPQRLRGSLVRDQWMRNTQIAMSGIGSHGSHVHLYLNGIYWGVYNPSERADAAFASTYLGGEDIEYDAMTHDGIRDGDNIAWNAMRALAASGLSTPSAYDAIRQYLDINHFIDYMIVNIYGGNQDWPHNNWNATRLRQPGAGYLFHCWDGERTLESTAINRVELTGSNNPAEFYAALRQNAEFRLAFADRLHRHFHNNGALTPAANIARWNALADSVQPAIFAEQARWGSYRNEIYDRNGPSPRYALDPHWTGERENLMENHFPVRSAAVLSQFQAANLYPNVEAPTFSQHGGDLPLNPTLTISAPAGTIHYTTDGTDPRTPITGLPSPQSLTYTTPLSPSANFTLKARVLDKGTWSALTEAPFRVEQEEPVFIPNTTADWTNDANWTGIAFPNSTARRARINAPSADRNINLRQPVTIGEITLAQANSPFRNRIRDRETGNSLTFDGASGNALIRVDGDGTGFVEFEVLAGTTLATDLTLEVNHTLGNPIEGALRLRSLWTGPGGITKTGNGTASLTGSGKNFTGPLEITEGVLFLTEPAVPTQASSVAVRPGGQLRLLSSGDPRLYTFATPLILEGHGRDPSLPDGAGLGKSGALRYDPGAGSNHAILNPSVNIASAATIHTEGSDNRLEIPTSLTGAATLTKTGGGTLTLGPDQSAFTGPLTIQNGTLHLSGPLASPITLAPTATLTGHGTSTSINGNGSVRLLATTFRANTAESPTIEALFQLPENPDLTQPSQSGNGTLILSSPPTEPATVRIHLANPTTSQRGGLFITPPNAIHLPDWLRQSQWKILIPDPAGTHVFDGQTWSPHPEAQLVTVPHTATLNGQPVTGRILEVRIGHPPSTFTRWRETVFTAPADLLDPEISGPTPQNLLRYALGAQLDLTGRLPTLTLTENAAFRFPFDPGRDDITVRLQATHNLADWSNADILFDSSTQLLTPDPQGDLTITTPITPTPRFFRLHITLNP